MNAITHDPLLAIAKGILWFLMGTMLIAAAACLVAMPVVHIYQDQMTLELAKEAPGLTVPVFVWVLTGILACSAALVLILFRLFQLLGRIVGTVGQGDPFVPDNARRLTQMAWLTLAVQLVTLPIGAAASWIERAVGDSPKVHTNINTLDFGVSGNGLLLMLILFILARVFRQGAAMRAELEGTV